METNTAVILSPAVTESKPFEAMLEFPFSASPGFIPVCTASQFIPLSCQSKSLSSKKKLMQTFEFHESNAANRTPVQVKEACMELLSILFRQDVSGFFHFPFKESKDAKNSLRHLERLVLTDKINNLSEFREKIDQLFESAFTNFAPTAPPVLEATRLRSITHQWFSCLYNDSLLSSEAKLVDSESKCEVNAGPGSVEDKDPFFSLNFLNPDNHGMISDTERVQTIGEEVGALISGTHLAQFGGYREDRRNKVIPYTYLNYGPFASFGPTFDSGSSNCTPEANQLLLGTFWQPARLLHLPVLEETYTAGKSDTISPFSGPSLAAANFGDFDLSVNLLDCEEEWLEGRKLAEELDNIIPPVGSGDDFSLYLANAIVRNLPKPTEDSFELEECSEIANINLAESESLTQNEANEPNDMDITDYLLTQSTQKLKNLYHAQYRRLGDYSAQSISDERCLQPSLCELENAYGLANDLVSMISNVRPCDVISQQSVRRQLGISDLPCFNEGEEKMTETNEVSVDAVSS